MLSRASSCVFAGLLVACAALADELPHLDIARAALRDGLWSVARRHADMAGGDEGRLILLESFASEDKWDEVKAELAKGGVPTNNIAFAYYQAVVDGRYEDALAALRSSGSEAGEIESKMLEADLRVKSGDLTEAKALWTEVLVSSNVSERAYAIASVNLGNEAAMRVAYRETVQKSLKELVGLRLGRSLLDRKETREEGEKLIRAISKDNPDAPEACDAFLALALVTAREKRWADAVKIYADLADIWPAAAKRADVHEGRGESLFRLGRYEESLTAFEQAEKLTTDRAILSRVILRQGDVLSELGRGEEAMRRYRTVLERYPTTETAAILKRLIDLRERETRARDLYKAYQFEEARKEFAEVAALDPSRKARMAFFEVLCFYGLGKDDTALAKAWDLSENCPDSIIRAEATLWLAKFTYNRCEWKDSIRLFTSFAEDRPTHELSPVALFWACRAAFASGDYEQSIQIATRLAERYPDSPVLYSALLVQAEALIARARYDEAILVLDRAATLTDSTNWIEVRLLRADALFAMGSDDASRYEAALMAYRQILLEEELDGDQRLHINFMVGRSLEKLKRLDEAIDQYYSHVVLAFLEGRTRGGRYGDKSRGEFSRAARWVVEEYERRGRSRQAINVLKLIVGSGLPAAAEAERKMVELYQKGLFQ